MHVIQTRSVEINRFNTAFIIIVVSSDAMAMDVEMRGFAVRSGRNIASYGSHHYFVFNS